MTLYLLDENVLREAGGRGNENVRRWLATVDDTKLRLSTATLFEKRRGAEAVKRRDPERAAKLLNAIDALEKSFADRILPIDGPVVAEWTRLLGEKNKDRWDMALAATARVHGLVLVTRNVRDFWPRRTHLESLQGSAGVSGRLTICARGPFTRPTIVVAANELVAKQHEPTQK